MMEHEIKTANIAKEYLVNEGYEIISDIAGGHRGALILRCQQKGCEVIVKIGVSEISAKEVDDNLSGYDAIGSAGGMDILPLPIEPIVTPVGKGIVMPFLGKNFKDTCIDSSSTFDIFQVFKKDINKLCRDTKIPDHNSHRGSLDYVLDRIDHHFSVIQNAEIVGNDYKQLISLLDTDKLASGFSALSLLDFTPDNIFIKNGGVKFIDPWNQDSYLGSPIPGLSQFITLGEAVYGLPGFNDELLQYNNFIREIGLSILKLSPKQLEIQMRLGRSLQMSLSSEVRIESARQLAMAYGQRAYEELHLAVDIADSI